MGSNRSSFVAHPPIIALLVDQTRLLFFPWLTVIGLDGFSMPFALGKWMPFSIRE
jgi:hypothetical protein